MNIVLEKPWTIDRFLSWEDGQEGRHELGGARVIPMTGASRAHRRIVLHLVRLLEDRVAPGAFARDCLSGVEPTLEEIYRGVRSQSAAG